MKTMKTKTAITPVRAIVARNLRLFFRDKVNVFFSLLGALILFLLYTLFLKNMQVEELEDMFPQASSADLHAFVDSWMFAGIVLIGTVTTGLGALSVFVEDGQSGRFRDFLVSPTRHGQIVVGYLLSAIGIAVIMSIAVIAVSVAYLAVVSQIWLGVATIARIGAITLLCCTAFTALCAFITTFVRTSGAFSALTTIVGTATGFIAVAYIPIGVLPGPVANTASALPFAQAGMLLREQYAAPALETLTGGNTAAIEDLNSNYGLDLSVGSWAVDGVMVLLILAALTVVFTLLSVRRIRARIG